MSNTKGSMLISNANAVGTELVNQLGGTGYTPAEWADAINLLGISDDDKASALAGITEGTYTGTERGAIKYSNCNAVGSMLNKKFSTNRGFKPVEWESAISKLTPLAEGTVSGAICNIVNGADRVPVKNWQVTLPASLDGYTEVNAVRSGKNLFDTAIAETKTHNSVSITCDGNGKYTATGTATGGSANITFTLKTPCTIKSGMYLHLMNGSANASVSITLQKQDNTTIYAPALSPANRIADLSSYAGQTIYSIRFYVVSGASFEMTLTPMLCFSSTATAYEAYSAPTQYTASLGRTIYGGTADVVNGTGTDKGVVEVFDTLQGDVIKSQFNSFNKNSGVFSVLGTNVRITFTVESGDQSAYNRISNSYTADEQLCNLAPHSFAYASDTTHWYRNTVLYLFLPVADVGSTAESVYNYLKGLVTNGTPLKLFMPYNTATAFTFTPLSPTPETPLGVSNWWADNGDSTINYRKDPDIPDPPVQLLNMNNNNEDNNEGV